MRLAYLPTWMVDFYGTYIDKYTLRPMDPLGFGICCGSHCWSVIFWNMLCFLMGIGVIQSACCKKHWKVSGGKTLRKSFGELFLEVLARWSGNVTPAVLPRKRTIPHPSSQILQWRCLYVLILLLYIYTYSVLYHDFENHRHIYLHKIFDVAFFSSPLRSWKKFPNGSPWYDPLRLSNWQVRKDLKGAVPLAIVGVDVGSGLDVWTQRIWSLPKYGTKPKKKNEILTWLYFARHVQVWKAGFWSFHSEGRLYAGSSGARQIARWGVVQHLQSHDSMHLMHLLHNTLNPWVLEGCKLCHSWVWELLVFQFHEEIFPPKVEGYSSFSAPHCDDSSLTSSHRILTFILAKALQHPYGWSCFWIFLATQTTLTVTRSQGESTPKSLDNVDVVGIYSIYIYIHVIIYNAMYI